MSETSDLKARLVELRDQLKSVVDTYSTLCIYLREVESLSDYVASDYYELQSPSEEMIQRLNEWRSLERRILNAMNYHSQRNFTSYKNAEKTFIKKLHKSSEGIVPKRDCGIHLKVHRFKEGVIAMKYATEARRRVTNIADFMVQVKQISGHEPDDYCDNLIILQALTEWTKEVVKDAVRCTASSAEKFRDEESNGQIVYSNEVICKIIGFCAENTKVDSTSESRIAELIEKMLIHYNSSKSRSSDSSTAMKEYTNTSQITYYLFNLLRDLATGKVVANERLERFLNVCQQLNLQVYVSPPIHVYRHQEYFCNVTKSCEFVELVHSTQQKLLRTVSATFATELLRHILKVIQCPDWKTIEIRGILTAVRAAKYLSDPSKKKLLGIWDKPPFIK
ncbi:uncharacterized protein BXIN_2142 [Babesia sp. Xinjiang]|uniref:uncharacterized protein n=1 Tax=Babesia sp. Xinjiang TaxID=462227 RepID=UPI000A2179E7|nr:uncharacterized protein BXIN_2142 [Babesia sp. Xinjiang]ORM40513.1 hypothetical protein BXIN_2142 [Babesia sp. Xinjiang]